MAFPQFGRCIYCEFEDRQTSKPKLSTEHILPVGFGGFWVLPKASCEECQEKIKVFETTAMRGGFRAPRLAMGFGRRKEVPATLPLFNVTDENGVFHERLDLSLADYPPQCFMPVLAPPAILCGSDLQFANDRPLNFWVYNPPVNPNSRHIRLQQYQQPGFHAASFYQMLAKIGHAAACAEFREGFEPLLRSRILKCAKDVSSNQHNYFDEFVGGYMKVVGGRIFDSHQPTSHNGVSLLSEFVQLSNSDWLLSYRVQLFAHVNSPTYRVIAGRFDKKPDQRVYPVETTERALRRSFKRVT